MSSEELKISYSMDEVVRMYGYTPNRSGFIQCPFHKGDRTGSLKIYKDSYHCFGCGKSGDIFTFVQEHENLTFKEAYLSLGGTYSHEKPSQKLELYRLKKAKAQKEKEAKRKKEEDSKLARDITMCRLQMEVYEPFSEIWCNAQNKLQYLLHKFSESNGILY